MAKHSNTCCLSWLGWYDHVNMIDVLTGSMAEIMCNATTNKQNIVTHQWSVLDG